jgi:hypothetical protein
MGQVIKYRKIIINTLCIILLVLFIFSISPVEFQNDTLFDIVLGKQYVTEGVKIIDEYSIHPNLTYQTHHYLVNIFLYFINNIYGFKGLYILQLIITSIVVFLFYTLNKRFLKSNLAYIFTFVEISIFSYFISVRAQVFSSILFLIELLIINILLYDKISKYKRNLLLIILILLPMLIINVHAGVIFFYYIILGCYLVNFGKFEIIRIIQDKEINFKNLRLLILPFIVSVPLLIINPYGIKALTYMNKTLSNSFINLNIQEFQPLSLTSEINFFILLYITFYLLILLLSDKKLKITEFLIFFGTIFMTFLAIRHFIFFIITSVILLSHLQNVFDKFKKYVYKGMVDRGPKIMKNIVYLSLLISCIVLCINSLDKKAFKFLPETSYPIKAVDYIKQNINKESRIYNQYSWGSYMMYNNIKVFIDSRCDLYTKEYNNDTNVAEDYMDIYRCDKYYIDIINKYNIEYFLIDKEAPLTKMLLNDSRFIIEYEDDICYFIKYKKQS